MSDTTSMYRTSQQIGNGEHGELLLFCVVEFMLQFDCVSGLFRFCLLILTSQHRLLQYVTDVLLYVRGAYSLRI